jgi:hypothetical protein
MAATLSSPDGRVHPSALGGTYLRKQHSLGAWTQTYEGLFSRLDLYVGVGLEADTNLNGGNISVAVFVKTGASWTPVPQYNTTVTTFVPFNAQSSAPAGGFFYDGITRDDGTNAAVITLLQAPFDEYKVEISPAGVNVGDVGATDCVYRLNGIAEYDKDPVAPVFSKPLSTLGGILELSPESNERDRKNHVIVVGAREAVVTDSEKFNRLQQDNPNNPMPEFFVSVAADPFSIYDPTAPQFTGGKNTTVIVDDKITDGDFANWLSRLLLYRYKMPRMSGSLTHTALPTLELRDAIRIEDAKLDLYKHMVWVTEFEEVWNEEGATVTLQVASFPELPSFTPRGDVDIRLFNNRPIYDLDVSYENLYGYTVNKNSLRGNLQHPTVTWREEPVNIVNGVHTTQSNFIPESFSFSRPRVSPIYTRLVNHPYRRFYDVVSWNGTAGRVAPDFQEGDGTDGVYTPSYYQFPASSWNASYSTMGIRSGSNPFYDPYTSEIGNLITLNFHTLISGLYRISVWARSESGEFEAPVAWLTAPTGEPLDPDAHWAYYDAGAGRSLTWDSVDTIGYYNREQSKDFARKLETAFNDEPLAVGSGHYAWNDQRVDIQTQIGDPIARNTEYDASGNVTGWYFTLGRYGKFYVKVEAKSDSQLRSSRNVTPVEVNTRPKTNDNPYGQDPTLGEFDWYIWTHLGEPSQVTMEPQDWIGAPWAEGTSSDNFQGQGVDTDGTIRENKPIRFGFKAKARRGYLFRKPGATPECDPRFTHIQLFKQVHLNATVFDQFWLFMGKDWDTEKKENRGHEERRLVSRMYHNDEHTVSFQDNSWRSGDELNYHKWVFAPKDFRKDFGAGIEEALRYGDYEQLETIPGHDPKRAGGTARGDKGFITYAYINYLFYFSAFVQDRSGRRQWCINDKFIDKSKIVTPSWRTATFDTKPNYAISYVRLNAEEHLIRTVVTRQWVEPTWTSTYPGNPVQTYNIPSSQLRFVQPKVTDFDVHTAALAAPSPTSETDNLWLRAWNNPNSYVNRLMQRRATARSPAIIPGSYHLSVGSTLGTWSFNRRNGQYKVCPSIDFHPYWNKFMPDFNVVNPGNDYGWEATSVLAGTGTQVNHKFRDVSARDTWYGWAYDTSTPNVSTYDAATVEDSTVQFMNRSVLLYPDRVYDYQRIDTLSRFDQFRGVISRGDFQARTADATFYDNNSNRVAPAQPVKSAGAYLLNVGKYDDYIVGAVHKRRPDIIIHSTEKVSDWFDIKFRHEYVWYSAKYFPVKLEGASAYHRMLEEYKVPSAHPQFMRGIYYDAGAWTGWKDDRSTTQWNANPFLRWAEWYAISHHYEVGTKYRDGGGGDYRRAALCGGYQAIPQETNFASTGLVNATRRYQGLTATFRRENIFEGPRSEAMGDAFMRLAVGPEVPENKRLVMNLLLPERLSR